jgi:hypothetical protein
MTRKPHKTMTPEQYAALPIEGWHEVCRNVDGFGGVGVRFVAAAKSSNLEIARKELFDRGKEVLGGAAGGVVQRLLAVKHGNLALARAAIEQASTMDDPNQYIGGILRGGENGKTTNGKVGFSGIAARIRHGELSRGQPPEDLEPINRR